MLALGIETATWMGSIALVDDREGVLGELNIKSASSHSERLIPSIDMLFKETKKHLEECEVICVSIGPGSFTGLRIGLATAKGLAFAADKPIVGISTLEILARGIPFARFPICPIIDARKKEVFTSIYKWHDFDITRLEPEMAIKPDSLIRMITEPTIFVGNGLFPYGDAIRNKLKSKALFVSEANNFPRASILAESGIKRLTKKMVSSPEDLVPVYIRPSEAELNRKGMGG
ncbi:MAG: tRNA (adenosine(37)-N6)-threonylcarbamoyltransferase complex dimerization subunit type 1 TsaB [bacterium]